MFKVKGKINENEYTLIYKDDVLTGDKMALEKAREENKKEHGSLGIIPGQASKDYLDHECAALELVEKYVFDEVIQSEYDWYDNDEDDENTFY